MKHRAATVALTALVALLAASGASARCVHRASPDKLAASHALATASQHAAYRSIDRRGGRHLF